MGKKGGVIKTLPFLFWAEGNRTDQLSICNNYTYIMIIFYIY